MMKTLNEIMYATRQNFRDPEYKTKFIKNMVFMGILGGLVGLGTHAAINQANKYEFVPKDRIAVVEQIDKDELSDLVVGGKILLADKTEEGTVYRQLRDSDIYRIK